MTTRSISPDLIVLGSAEDPRLGRLVSTEPEAADVVILGCADDTGVANSGGRVGAAAAPTEIRRWLYKQTLGMSGELAGLHIADLGDVMPEGTIEQTHAALEAAAAGAARTGAVVIFLGGGHDLAYASQSGVFSARPGRGAVVNVDTHLDVRPLKDGSVITSGTPFRRLLERWGNRVSSFLELGVQPQHNSKAHAEYVRSKGGRITTLDDLRQAPGVIERMKRELGATIATADFGTVSLDMDVALASVAPGVSAPPADGLGAEELMRFCEQAGRHPKVHLLDIVEVAPPHDENGRTARLAALCLWRFLFGIANR